MAIVAQFRKLLFQCLVDSWSFSSTGISPTYFSVITVHNSCCGSLSLLGRADQLNLVSERPMRARKAAPTLIQTIKRRSTSNKPDTMDYSNDIEDVKPSGGSPPHLNSYNKTEVDGARDIYVEAASSSQGAGVEEGESSKDL